MTYFSTLYLFMCIKFLDTQLILFQRKVKYFLQLKYYRKKVVIVNKPIEKKKCLTTHNSRIT
jgi:hypothetical protein